MSWSLSMYERKDASDQVGVDLEVEGVCVGIDGEFFDVLAVWSLVEVGVCDCMRSCSWVSTGFTSASGDREAIGGCFAGS